MAFSKSANLFCLDDNTDDNQLYFLAFRNTSDYQINVDFVQPYADSALQVPWYQSLGVNGG